MPDLCLCGDARDMHRGRGGCRLVDCGCDRFEADEEAAAAEHTRVLTAVAEVCEYRAAKARQELGDPPDLIGADDAWLCLNTDGCGLTFTPVGAPAELSPHPCGPLTPVRITVTRRKVMEASS